MVQDIDKILDKHYESGRRAGYKVGLLNALRYALGDGICVSIDQVKDAIAEVERTGELPEGREIADSGN